MWCTPPKYIEAILSFFGGRVDLDPYANDYSIAPASTKYSLPQSDGLAEPWNYEHIFVNPPYGSDRLRGTTIRDWLRNCQAANETYGAEVLALIPVATNTRHWKEHVLGKAAGICFLADTRLKFMIRGRIDLKGAPMSCAMVYWGNDAEKFVDVFSQYGAAIEITHLRCNTNRKKGA